jgi:hypothetical protein
VTKQEVSMLIFLSTFYLKTVRCFYGTLYIFQSRPSWIWLPHNESPIPQNLKNYQKCLPEYYHIVSRTTYTPNILYKPWINKTLHQTHKFVC